MASYTWFKNPCPGCGSPEWGHHLHRGCTWCICCGARWQTLRNGIIAMIERRP